MCSRSPTSRGYEHLPRLSTEGSRSDPIMGTTVRGEIDVQRNAHPCSDDLLNEVILFKNTIGRDIVCVDILLEPCQREAPEVVATPSSD